LESVIIDEEFRVCNILERKSNFKREMMGKLPKNILLK
jgi:hypothetical protein